MPMGRDEVDLEASDSRQGGQLDVRGRGHQVRSVAAFITLILWQDVSRLCLSPTNAVAPADGGVARRDTAQISTLGTAQSFRRGVASHRQDWHGLRGSSSFGGRCPSAGRGGLECRLFAGACAGTATATSSTDTSFKLPAVSCCEAEAAWARQNASVVSGLQETSSCESRPHGSREARGAGALDLEWHSSRSARRRSSSEFKGGVKRGAKGGAQGQAAAPRSSASAGHGVENDGEIQVSSACRVARVVT